MSDPTYTGPEPATPLGQLGVDFVEEAEAWLVAPAAAVG